MPTMSSGCDCHAAIKKLNVGLNWDGFPPFMMGELAPPVRHIFQLYTTLTFSYSRTSPSSESGTAVFTWDRKLRVMRVAITGDDYWADHVSFNGEVGPVTTADPTAELSFEGEGADGDTIMEWSATHFLRDTSSFAFGHTIIELTLSNPLSIADIEAELATILLDDLCDFSDPGFRYPLGTANIRTRTIRWIREYAMSGVTWANGLTTEEDDFFDGMNTRGQVVAPWGVQLISGNYRYNFPTGWADWTNDTITARLLWADTDTTNTLLTAALVSYDLLVYTDMADANSFFRSHIRSRLREGDHRHERNYCVVEEINGFTDSTGAGYSATTRSGFSLQGPAEYDFPGLLIAPETSPVPRLIEASETISRDYQPSVDGLSCEADEVLPC